MNKKKTPKSLQKPLPIVDTTNSFENIAQFEVELCWCVQHMEQIVFSGKLSKKNVEDLVGAIRTLKSSTAPLARKRQLMKNILGDYRQKMKEEEKKLSLAAKQIKFNTNPETQPKFNFVKKSAILSSGKDFRFNFEHDQNKKDSETQQTQSESSQKSLNFSNGSEFKFNFAVEEDAEINLNGLSIKS